MRYTIKPHAWHSDMYELRDGRKRLLINIYNQTGADNSHDLYELCGELCMRNDLLFESLDDAVQFCVKQGYHRLRKECHRQRKRWQQNYADIKNVVTSLDLNKCYLSQKVAWPKEQDYFF